MNLHTREQQLSWNFENAWRIVQAVGSTSVKRYADRLDEKQQEIAALLSPTGIMYLYRCSYNKIQNNLRIQIFFAEDHQNIIRVILVRHQNYRWCWTRRRCVVPEWKDLKKLLERILDMSTEEGDWVLDCFWDLEQQLQLHIKWDENGSESKRVSMSQHIVNKGSSLS